MPDHSSFVFDNPTTDITSPGDMLGYALAWADRGFAVFRLEVGGKSPLPGSHGHLDATLDRDQITSWWSERDIVNGHVYEYNVGVRPPVGHCVIDLDEKDGRQGVANWLSLGGTVDGLVVRTPTGGYHVYTQGADLRNTAGELGVGIDTRGHDGFVIAPGSRTEKGSYELVADGPVIQTPAFVSARIRPRGYVPPTVLHTFIASDLPANVARAIEHAKRFEPAETGQWHSLGFRLGCDLCRAGLSPEKAVEVARDWWVPRGTGFASDEQFQRDLLGGFRDAEGKGESGCAALQGDDPFEGVSFPQPDTGLAAGPRPEYGSLRLLSVADCENAPARRHVIKGFLSAGDVGLVVGNPGCGKSVLTPDMGYAVAQGRPFLGQHKTRPGKVLYVAAEDPHGMSQRITALRKRHGAADQFYVVHGATGLFANPSQRADLLRMIRTEKPTLVIIDTLAAAFCGVKENESGDEGMPFVVRTAREMAKDDDGQPGPAVIIAHHTPKSDPSGVRGHGSLHGDADTTIALAKDGQTGVVEGILLKNRSGPCYGIDIAFSIESVPVGVDEDGDAITAPVLAVADAASRDKRERLSGQELAALEILNDLIAEGGPDVIDRMTGNHYGLCLDGFAGLRDEVWREACAMRGLTGSQNKSSQAKAFGRARRGLSTKGRIKTWAAASFVPVLSEND